MFDKKSFQEDLQRQTSHSVSEVQRKENSTQPTTWLALFVFNENHLSHRRRHIVRSLFRITIM